MAVYKSTDPSYRWRQLEQLTSVASMIAGVRNEKKQKEQERAARQMQVVQQGVQQGHLNPESPRVKSAVDRFTADNPEQADLTMEMLRAMHADARNRSAPDRAMRKIGQMIQETEAGIAAANQMVNPLGLPQQGQFETPGRGELVQAAVDKGLSGSEYASLMGDGFGPAQPPAQFDPYGGDLPPEQRAVLAAEQGKLPPGDPRRAARVGADIAPGISDEQKAASERGRNQRQRESLEYNREALELRRREQAQEEREFWSKQREREQQVEQVVKSRAEEIKDSTDLNYKEWKDSGTPSERGPAPKRVTKQKAERMAKREAEVLSRAAEVPGLQEWAEQARERIRYLAATDPQEHEETLKRIEKEIAARTGG